MRPITIGLRRCCTFLALLVALLTPSEIASAQTAAEPVKLSVYGICHAPGTTYYAQTKRFTAFATLADCLKSGGTVTETIAGLGKCPATQR